MKATKVIVGTLSCLCIGATASMYQPTKVLAVENQVLISVPYVNTIFPAIFGVKGFKTDFEHDKVGAEKWAKEYYKKWNDSLPKEQVDSLKELKDPSSEDYNINITLKFLGGDINNRPIDGKEITERYKKDIEAIDKALNNRAGKTSDKMYVYKDMEIYDFNKMFPEGIVDSSNSNKIDMNKLKDFKKNLSYGISSDYLIVKLAERTGGEEGTLKWRIEIPSGTKTGHLGEDQLVFERNTGLEITNIKVINQQGKEYVRIDAKLVAKDKIDARIKETEVSLNKSWNELFGLPPSTQFIQLRASDRFASSVMEGVRSQINEMVSNVPNHLVRRIVDYMVEKNGKFIFTDNLIRNIPEAYFPQEPTKETLNKYMNEVKGIFNNHNRDLIVRGYSEGSGVIHADNVETLTHEFGHAFDYYLSHLFQLDQQGRAISDYKKFQDIFAKEGNNLTEYGKTSSAEYFAETFMMMHSNNPEIRAEVKQKAPETFKYITDLIEGLKSIPYPPAVQK